VQYFTHTHARAHTHTHTYTNTHTLLLSLAHTHARAHAHTLTRAHTPHTHAHTHTTHTNTHTHTHTHTHSYEVDGVCHCMNADGVWNHGENNTLVDTPVGPKTIEQICTAITAMFGEGSLTGRVYVASCPIFLPHSPKRLKVK
jgi:hypothetical protein